MSPNNECPKDEADDVGASKEEEGEVKLMPMSAVCGLELTC